MEVDIEIQQTKKMNSRVDSLSQNSNNKMDEDDDSKAVADPNAGALGRYYGWPASRIVRVSRASGGKDRHSKVLTSKGLRDRRVRLSVNTAIQFYDLQDRLGYDQPSKAVEWLLKAAADSISELPPITTHFPDTPKQLSYEKRSFPGQLGVDSAELDVNSAEPGYQNQNQNNNSSNSEETSKGSGLSLSRSENRIKARERAKGRVMDNKDKEVTTTMHPVSSFTELLNGGMGNGSRNGSPNGQWGTTGIAGMEYYGLMGRNASMFSVSTEHQHQQQQFSFVPDHYVNNGEGNNGYNLNFSISNNNNDNGNQSTGSSSAALAGFNRGTLQSNSSSLLPNLHRFNPAAIDGSSQSFFTAPVENHHQYVPGFDGRLHLSYGDSDSGRHSRGKGKN